jgi:formate dehydrogenase major subunit
VIQGSNMAECHPVGFRWVMEAKNRGATIIHVDPRFSRTSAVSDLFVPIRAGTDIAFLGGIVRHILETGQFFRDYVVSYTNAATLLDERYRDAEDGDGVFSGFDADQHKYRWDSWSYEGVSGIVPAAGHKESLTDEPGAGGADVRGTRMLERRTDPTLQDPRCVFQVLRRHYARYTPELVEEACGIPKALFLRVAETLCKNSGRERTGAFCYAVGWTQHSVGVQYIRTAAIVQLLLGNMGRPGGGIMALRGHASIQGSTDIPTLYDLLPGYLPMPSASLPDRGFERYVANNQSPTGWWSNFPKYAVSLCKAWFGDAATKENGWLFDHLPRLTGNHSHMTSVCDMADGKLRGFFVMGENPTVGSMHGSLVRKGLRGLEWLVVRDFHPTETAEFWRVAPEIARGEVKPEDIETEVFFFPAATHVEKEGTFTNTQRLLQWREEAVAPPGDCRSELWFTYHLGRILKERYASSTAERDRGLRALTWDYPTHGPHAEPSAEAVLQEVNGWTVADRRLVPGFAELKDDGSTACGCWIYSGCYKDGVNQTARRKPGREQTWVAPEWGWAWPANRRLLYSRASADPDGRPWSERKRYVWWDEQERRWTGYDVPDFIADRPPSYRPPADAQGVATIGGADPFIMQADGKGWLFAPSGLLDGPLPTHYEPIESVVPNPLYGQQCNPSRIEWERRDNPSHLAHGDPRFPHVLTTYRLTEHHTAGAMSRWLSWLSELQPAMFCEVSPELAEQVGLVNRGWATLTTARGEIECRVLVTRRMRPLRVGGRTIHQIGLPYHWSYVGRSTGDAANELIPFTADPNVSIQESKAFTGAIRPGRHSFGRRSATDGAGLRAPEPRVAPPRDRPEIAGTRSRRALQDTRRR